MRLREEISKLTRDAATANSTIKSLNGTIQSLLEYVGGTFPTTTLPVPTVLVQGVKVKAGPFQYAVLATVIIVMLLLWALPLMKPFKRCCESKIYKVFPIITVINFLIFGAAMEKLNMIQFNDLFFETVMVIEIVINSTQKVLMAFAALVVLVLFWKFKDRILETLGVDHPEMVIGEFRDWATMWSMKRFYPIELFIWKVDGLPGLHLHQFNDVFVEVSCGYNNTMRTRVHPKAGHNCILKESLQLNFDHFDTDTRLHISIRNQDVMGATDIASIQLGAKQVKRFLEMGPGELQASQRTLGWGTMSGAAPNSAWQDSRFTPIDLIPAGQIFLRFQPVQDEDKIRGTTYGHAASC